jgi:phage terminase large subunit-like protein
VDIGIDMAVTQNNLESPPEDVYWEGAPQTDGAICFFNRASLFDAKRLSTVQRVLQYSRFFNNSID